MTSRRPLLFISSESNVIIIVVVFTVSSPPPPRPMLLYNDIMITRKSHWRKTVPLVRKEFSLSLFRGDTNATTSGLQKLYTICLLSVKPRTVSTTCRYNTIYCHTHVYNSFMYIYIYISLKPFRWRPNSQVRGRNNIKICILLYAPNEI